jgi:hypothetical protein
MLVALGIFLAGFAVLSMWCGVMDVLYDVRRDVATIRGFLEHPPSSDSVNAHVQSTCESNALKKQA